MLTYKEFQPSKALSDIVLRYYDISGKSSIENPYELSAFPLVNSSWVFHYGDIIQVEGQYYPTGNTLPRQYMLGQFNRPIFIKHNFGTIGVFGVVFRAGSAYRLNNNSQLDFKNLSVSLEDIYGRQFRSIPEKFFYAKNSVERVNIIEKLIKSCLARTDSQESIIDDVVLKIISNSGEINVGFWAKAHNINRSYLTNSFKKKVGLNIKEFAKIVRFNHALAYWKQFPDIKKSHLVGAFGYHDFSHLSKDFKEFTFNKDSKTHNTDDELALFLNNKR
ncbi:MAG: helix-turn-helix domain-containing protein [Bacteroidia bacterium]|nr:helix-turn-helix domain-containing protein [Bacteroidia bacterium]